MKRPAPKTDQELERELMDEAFARYVRRLQAVQNPTPRIVFAVAAMLLLVLLYLGLRTLLPF